MTRTAKATARRTGKAKIGRMRVAFSRHARLPPYRLADTFALQIIAPDLDGPAFRELSGETSIVMNMAEARLLANFIQRAVK